MTAPLGCREEFEKWALTTKMRGHFKEWTDDHFLRRSGPLDGYDLSNLNDMLESWQAALASRPSSPSAREVREYGEAVREACAAVADYRAKQYATAPGSGGTALLARKHAAMEIAIVIRDLALPISPDTGGGGEEAAE